MQGLQQQVPGAEIIRRLRGLARARRAAGDARLQLQAAAQAQEFLELQDTGGGTPGLVLEPAAGGPFDLRTLGPRRRGCAIGAFCDGTRATYLVGFDDGFPLLYTENAAAARARDSRSGYHRSLGGITRAGATLLAPLGVMSERDPRLGPLYRALGLCPTPYADLCWFDDGEAAPPLDEVRRWGCMMWQARGQRRARRLMELVEQVVTVATAAVVREAAPNGSRWVLSDGSLFGFDKKYLKAKSSQLAQVVGLVKSHPVPFFGVDGERLLLGMGVGERSVCFLPRSADDAREGRVLALADSPRPMISWYLRVRPPQARGPEALTGVVRLDLAVQPGWRAWPDWAPVVDAVSWAVLDESYGLSAAPDPRADVMPYGIAEVEQALKARRTPADLLLAGLAR